ncbi:MAG: 50S ribosomal protein L13 [Flavobacteriales bacterium]|nr:50S ribosomal protein L13 [Flavobacteriales bacterium]MCX7649530.1 50S ribosomal protein L13 [Flavobacteriales bacterium]MDW8431243.1 50S ribosomal protein L13 [Flavobacteriales bacterium]
MNTLSYSTRSLRKEDVEKKWYVVDAENQTVGRLASRIARILRGKHKPSFTPHVDCGDVVVVVNADKVRFTGKKMDEKVYVRYTGYPGGQRFATPARLLATHPERVLELAIRRMLPKNRLGRRIFINNLKVYAGTQHPHEAQKPEPLNLNNLR